MEALHNKVLIFYLLSFRFWISIKTMMESQIRLKLISIWQWMAPQSEAWPLSKQLYTQSRTRSQPILRPDLWILSKHQKVFKVYQHKDQLFSIKRKTMDWVKSRDKSECRKKTNLNYFFKRKTFLQSCVINNLKIRQLIIRLKHNLYHNQ